MDKYTQKFNATERKTRLAHQPLIGMLLAVSGISLLAGCSRPPSYEQDIRPILASNCFQCHQPGGIGYERSGLDMRTYESLMKGTKFGPVIIPRDSYDSVLVELIEHRASPSISMPYHKMQISNSEIEDIKKWIDDGAKP